jgi:hypothetical protein
MVELSHTRKKRLLSQLFAANLAFNLLWLAGSFVSGLFDKDSFLPSNSLRRLAYAYYGPTYRESRFVGIALQELYDTPTLVTSKEILSYLFEVEEIRFHTREVQIQLVDDPAAYLDAMPEGDFETYIIGAEGKEREVAFVLPDEDAPPSRVVVSVRDGARVLFVPLPLSGD